MHFKELPIPGCYLVQASVRTDERGSFTKTYVERELARIGLRTNFVEEYFSVSRSNVLRGLHFQLPPHDHDKLVYCVHGAVLDAVVDLRVGSPSFGRFLTNTLSAENGRVIYIPSGCAHGFYALSDHATVMYKVTSDYAPDHDTGILWNSVGIEWPCISPIVSQRDRSFTSLNDFVSPFRIHNAKKT